MTIERKYFTGFLQRILRAIMLVHVKNISKVQGIGFLTVTSIHNGRKHLAHFSGFMVSLGPARQSCGESIGHHSTLQLWIFLSAGTNNILLVQQLFRILLTIAKPNALSATLLSRFAVLHFFTALSPTERSKKPTTSFAPCLSNSREHCPKFLIACRFFTNNITIQSHRSTTWKRFYDLF